jgi:propanol-preferring alcohol dehydrogenase
LAVGSSQLAETNDCELRTANCEPGVKAMVLDSPAPVEQRPLELRERPVPEPAPGEVVLNVRACGVCRTDLHVVEGELPDPKLPLVPGHQVVATVEAVGEGVDRPVVGDRVGLPWLGGTDGTCPYCRHGDENLCEHPTFTGYQRDGGYAEYVTARADFVLPLPDDYPDLQAAPLLCAGLIGYRALRLTRIDGLEPPEADIPPRLGLYGFGSSAHIVIQVARHLGHDVYVCTRGERAQQFARELGARWTGGADERPPVPLDAAIIFAPAGTLVPVALRAVRRGGTVVCAGIHMSPIPEFPYDLLWGERVLRSVANLTRIDGHEFMKLAPRLGIRTTVQEFALEDANEALVQLKSGALTGAAVLVP